MIFGIRRGTNISHWLSQSERRGAERRAFFTREDVRRIRDFGLDHIRLPVDEVQLWAEGGGREDEAFGLLSDGIGWCLDEGLSVIVDLHILRSHYFNARDGTPPLFVDPAARERFIGCWEDLSAHLSGLPLRSVAYELLNEPVAPDPAMWNAVARAAFDALRAREPGRTIFLGSNWYNTTVNFPHLEVPDDDGIVLTFHYYNPMLLTHHRARWWEGGFHSGPVHYPGRPVSEEALAGLSPGEMEFLRRWNEPYDVARIEADLQPALAKAAEHGAALHCGEFGCYAQAPEGDRVRWYTDVVGLFERHGIAWSNWDYRGNFGLVDEGREPTAAARAIAGVLAR